MNKIHIFYFSGKLGSGKDYLSEVLKSMLPRGRRTLNLALADHFKVAAMATKNFPYESIYVKKTAETRTALQQLGTEQGRNVFGEDVWVNHLQSWMRAHLERGIDTFFITDNRFLNELDAARKMSNNPQFKNPSVKMIRVKAPQRTHARCMQEANGDPVAYQRIIGHISETALDHLDDSEFDLVVNNDPDDNGIDVIRDFALKLTNGPSFRHVVFLDLDDTLCYCSKYYIECTDEAREHLVRYMGPSTEQEAAKIREMFDEHFASHRQNYEKVEFDRSLFADALAGAAYDTFLSFCPDGNPGGIIYEVHSIGMDVFNREFAPLGDSPETALWLNQLTGVKVVIVTVGERPDQLRKIWKLGLGSLDCECTHLKSVAAYQNWMKLYPAERYTMVGDSLIRDVVPAVAAGIGNVIQIVPENHQPEGDVKYATSLRNAIPLIV